MEEERISFEVKEARIEGLLSLDEESTILPAYGSISGE